jgi:hypothetical protein
VLAAVEEGKLQGWLCATTVTGSVLLQALEKTSGDYEDLVLEASALLVGVEGIVTRNAADFKRSTLPIYLPGDVLKLV